MRENFHCDKLILNLKIFSNDDIFCKIKKFGMVLYQVRLNKKKYYSSDLYKISLMNYEDLIKFFCDENSKINFETEEFSVFIDNEKKNINVERKR
ncbi:MAG: hypothetical protein LBD32_00040 [Cytophagales bacterium]|jgi:hypothetical protein|nr:hypothetical protein [Cytophagales bacterium]